MLKIAVLALALAPVLVALPSYSLEETNPNVVNGSFADIRDFPYVVSIRYQRDHNCGGSILSEIWVLTTASCEGTQVQYNSSQVSREGDNIIDIDSWIRHSGFNSQLRVNNIAVVRLKEAMELGRAAQPLKFPPQNYEIRGSWEQVGILAGWGYNATGGLRQTTLTAVDLRIVSHAECATIHNFTIYDSTLCAGVRGGGKGHCSGDGGAPLRENGTNYVVGIVAWGVAPCAMYPGVYTKLSYFRNWVELWTGLRLA